MVLTPEEFNRLVSKAEFNELKTEVADMHQEMNEKFDLLLTAVDGLAKNVNDSNFDRVANITAHERFNDNFKKISKKLDLKLAA